MLRAQYIDISQQYFSPKFFQIWGPPVPCSICFKQKPTIWFRRRTKDTRSNGHKYSTTLSTLHTKMFSKMNRTSLLKSDEPWWIACCTVSYTDTPSHNKLFVKMRTLTLTTWALAVIAIAFADETIEKTSLRGSDVVKAVDAVTVSKEAIAVVASEDALVTPQQGKFVTRRWNVAFNLLTS